MNLLILRSLLGRATSEEEERLRQWRGADPENERTYRSVAELWSITGKIEPVLLSEDRPDPEALIRRAEAPEIRAVPTGSSGNRRPGRPWLGPVLAGALAASFGAIGFGLGVLSDSAEPANWMRESEIVTGSGELTTLTLRDGTSVRLGPRSRLRLGTEPREVWLEGRAFFGVSADPSRTFTVRTGQGEAVVLGTRFEVRSEEEEFRVLVVEGRVAVSAAGMTVDLTEGQMSRSRAGGAPSTKSVDDILDHLRWMGSALVFQGTPLRVAVEEIRRRYDFDVSIESAALNDMAVTATFTGQSVTEIMSVLCEIVGANCLFEERQVRMRGRSSLSRAVSGAGDPRRDVPDPIRTPRWTDSPDGTPVRAAS